MYFLEKILFSIENFDLNYKSCTRMFVRVYLFILCIIDLKKKKKKIVSSINLFLYFLNFCSIMLIQLFERFLIGLMRIKKIYLFFKNYLQFIKINQKILSCYRCLIDNNCKCVLSFEFEPVSLISCYTSS